ncbi:PLP-dependent aminotransferase family protein [Rivibacter subsaxonicus]|uniref:DNA-binding transcriptional MocR family regulator n=1 Tax=Rivibacter subsaxonicus TaxID=457575 RepID=A0A4Q7VVT2_9BURK|nr:PLP-dependent aminotransferase family protein [Rivibacter subsaxonicus]RZU00703.1 DNA-binding transcriptional MocR family regulator [Rivibacter subsaxonicus]
MKTHLAPLSRHAGSTLTEQLAARFAQHIRERLMAPGARLPSVRECAQQHGVSPHTVVAAYDQLLAQGLVEARAQRGFYVRAPATPTRRAAAPASSPAATRPPIDATALIRGMFQREGAKPSPGLGILPPDWLDLPALAGALRKASSITNLGALSLQYGDPAGDLRLREALTHKLREFGVQAAASQIISSVGATHGLDIVSRTLLQPGDAVLVDEPGWAVEFARLQRLGMRILPVPRDAEGPDLAVMQRLIEAHKPRMYVTVSVLHNPTGGHLSLARAHRLLTLAQEADLWIVEDDTYAWLAPPHLPRLAALDGLQRTLYVSGFSKVLAPSWRVGFIAAPPALVDALVDTKLLGTLSSPALLEHAVAILLEQGALRRHAERLRERLDGARARTLHLLEAAGCRAVTPPQGLFAWIDVGADTDRLAPTLLDAGWLTAPGSLFHADRRATTLMRVNVASSGEVGFWRALEKARLAQRR